MFLGIDIGTSSVKVVALDAAGTLVGERSAPLDVSRPRPLWSEQRPGDWWAATRRAANELAASLDGGLAGLRGIGLSGQMHGATLLDEADRPLRPAILWNDGRSEVECRELEASEPASRAITGNLAMPGFTAPKLLWVRRHEPDVFDRVRRVLLPKDYVRLCMTGDHATDLSDAAGTLWVDVEKRVWSEAMLAATGLSIEAMPALHEGPEVTGRLRAEVAEGWGCDRVPVVAGGGDNAAGAVGVGVVEPGQAFLSLGTSGVYFVVGDAYHPNPESAVHAFCHALPGRWHEMSVLLSAASCLSWITHATGAKSEAALLAEIEAQDAPASERLLFLPYLSGERTPHNDPHATGVFVGLDHDAGRAALGRAVLEGVALAFADAEAALRAGGARIDSVAVIGGGARSALWGRILASTLGRCLDYPEGGGVGPALGAARLARLGVEGGDVATICPPLPTAHRIEPEPALADRAAAALPRFRETYRALAPSFRASNESQEH